MTNSTPIALARSARRLAIAAGLTAANSALGGGTAENALILIDPARPDAMQIANHYITARDIPASNILYIDPTAANYPAFVARNVPATLGFLRDQRIEDHIDYLIAASPNNFFVPAPGLLSDQCSPVTRFSISGAYSMIYQASTVAAGGLDSERVNMYYANNATSQSFDSTTGWSGGVPSSGGRRYMIGGMLGWTGVLGNTVDQIKTMIDRSVAVDGTRPTGKFYFEQTTDPARSAPRHATFPAVSTAIINLGGQAEHQMAILPLGRHDCQGIMTGWADPGIATADMTILPGAFCDHLTSWAATFDIASQEKLSAWIARGASASWGQVEEPCNYPGKFPHARVHLHIFKGLSLGEACFRTLGFEPFQGLFYGDPLTRPFAYLPDVVVPDAPTGTVSGSITLTPTATTDSPGAAIAGIDLLVDGVLLASTTSGVPIALNTTQLSDGWHDLRAIAYDNTIVKSAGRWVGTLLVNNTGRFATLGVSGTTGDLSTPFVFGATAGGSGILELRLVQNGRVIAATTAPNAEFTVRGHMLGAGQSRLHAEALLARNQRVRSAPIEVNIAATSGSPTPQPPAAWNYTKFVRRDQGFVVELPASHDNSPAVLTYLVLSGPAQATAPAGQAGAARVFLPNPTASGNDSLTFRVDNASGSSSVATVNLIYYPCNGDANNDGVVGLSDLSILLANFGRAGGALFTEGDMNGDGAVNLTDLSILLGLFGSSC